MKPRVLLVDDNKDLREVPGVGLENRGFEVATASAAKEALCRITSENFFLSDLHTPDTGDGLASASATRGGHPILPGLHSSGNALNLNSSRYAKYSKSQPRRFKHLRPIRRMVLGTHVES